MPAKLGPSPSPAEVAVELPFTIVFEPPSHAELRAGLRMRGTWVAGLLVVLAIGVALLLWNVTRADARGSTASVPLQLLSQPAGAEVWVDGRAHGQTPVDVLVDPGAHDVLLRAPDVVDGQYAVQVGATGGALDALLWHRQPLVRRLRPTLPGAVLSDVRMLADGELALAIALPVDGQLQAWRLEPRSGAVQPLLTDGAATRLSVTADGQRVALLGYEVGPAPARPGRGDMETP